MVDAEKARFGEAVHMLGAAFGAEVTPTMLLAYWTALVDLELEHVRKACADLLKTSRFMPRPADIRELCPKPRSAGYFMQGMGYVGLLSLPAAHSDWTDEQKAEARQLLEAMKTKETR